MKVLRDTGNELVGWSSDRHMWGRHMNWLAYVSNGIVSTGPAPLWRGLRELNRGAPVAPPGRHALPCLLAGGLA